MDVSRSGRIRKKSSKLADFESPDEIDDVNPTNKKKRRLSNQVRSFLTHPMFIRFLKVSWHLGTVYSRLNEVYLKNLWEKMPFSWITVSAISYLEFNSSGEMGKQIFCCGLTIKNVYSIYSDLTATVTLKNQNFINNFQIC